MTNINDIGSFNYLMTKMSIFACSLLHVIRAHITHKYMPLVSMGDVIISLQSGLPSAISSPLVVFDGSHAPAEEITANDPTATPVGAKADDEAPGERAERPGRSPKPTTRTTDYVYFQKLR